MSQEEEDDIDRVIKRVAERKKNRKKEESDKKRQKQVPKEESPKKEPPKEESLKEEPPKEKPPKEEPPKEESFKREDTPIPKEDAKEKGVIPYSITGRDRNDEEICPPPEYLYTKPRPARMWGPDGKMRRWKYI